ncbi:mitochondrial import inner membrane translocase subunit Tim54p [[Candida] jaroonii]|uniref:Mitochondrial import inner membrane translocase subunit Tim54p n=1 Tax=[Candida] jaroonii TaxID=467808 RepID=A0ACA9Y3X2_9ASCO|nr:mitochondrial import inner membrane translocase subunit Tim54p [[Candida] jaroonii]
MVDVKDSKSVDVKDAAPKTGTESSPADIKGKVENATKVKKGWSNPALRMMGIPRLSLPSRNWMIFWGVLGTLGGAAYYDKLEQQRIRKEYMDKVSESGKQPYETSKLPRKLTVFIAPPPNDFLETSMVYFRRYVKPILNSASVDFDILVANKQGDIRTSVSERIRQLRRDEIAKKEQELAAKAQEAYEKSWTKFFTVTVPSTLKKPFVKEEIVDDVKNRTELYTPKDVLGFYYNNDMITAVREDSEDPQAAGGVVCIGRGAFKEYIQGVHEGLLGPLEKPEEPEKPEIKLEEVKEPELVSEGTTPVTESIADSVEIPVESAQTAESTESTNSPKEPEKIEKDEPKEEDAEDETLIKPFIDPKDYGKAMFAPEFKDGLNLENNKVPVFFEQPIYVFKVPNILGFTNFPRKIYNWFNRRYVAEEFSEKTMHIINNKSRPFEPRDEYLAKEEELLWPKKWVEKGLSKNSEWVKEVVVDKRVTKHLRVYE